MSKDGKPAWSAADCPADCYPDGAVATEVIRQIEDQRRSLDAGGAPFFLACGFKRPHLGWFAPQEYFDMYNTSELEIAKHTTPPQDSPAVAFSGNGEMCGMHGANCSTVDGIKLLAEDQHREMRRAYYAAVTFMDAQLLRVLEALEAQRLVDDTIVVFWGDHGYQLGEHGAWAKVTNWELGTRVPFVLAVPGVAGGSVSDALVEHLDVFPTLVEAAELPAPVDPITGRAQLEGRSLLPLLHGGLAAAFNASYSQIQRSENVQGLSVRSDRWRYTEWVKFDYARGVPLFNSSLGAELYDHSGDAEADFDAFENANVAASHPEVVAELAAALRWVHRPQSSSEPAVV